MLMVSQPPRSTGSSQQEVPADAFIQEVSPEQREYVERLAAATISLFNQENFVGNGIAIAKNLILIAADHAQNENLVIGKPEGIHTVKQSTLTLFGDNRDPFRILYIENPFLRPISLCIAANPGQSIQMRINPQTQIPVVKKLAESAEKHFRRVSIPHPLQQHSQESGAPIMSLTSGNVYSILQNDSTRLSVFDIYKRLKEAAVGHDEEDEEDEISMGVDRQINAVAILKEVFASRTSVISISIPLNEKTPVSEETSSVKKFGKEWIGDFTYTVLGENMIDVWPQNNISEHQFYIIDPPAKNEAFHHLAKYLSREWLRIKQSPQSISAKVAGIQYKLTRIEPHQSPLTRKEKDPEEKNPN